MTGGRTNKSADTHAGCLDLLAQNRVEEVEIVSSAGWHGIEQPRD